MPTKALTIVPFGKYKGQPIEALQADHNYCTWLASQEWFRERFAGIHTLIINNFAEPDETPEHNALQAKFLTADFRQRFVSCAITPDRFQWLATGPSAAKSALLAAARDQQNLRAFLPLVECAAQRVAAGWLPLLTIADLEFEKHGIDVVLDVDITYVLDDVRGAFRNSYDLSQALHWHCLYMAASFKIEIKPALGDDYPAILRRMRVSGARVLLIDRFTAAGATFDDVVKMFGSADIRLLTFAAIERTEPACLEHVDLTLSPDDGGDDDT